MLQFNHLALDCYVIIIISGYWRSSSYSDVIYSCEGVSVGCNGGIKTSDLSCATGYHGTLCGSCREGKVTIDMYEL